MKTKRRSAPVRRGLRQVEQPHRSSVKETSITRRERWDKLAIPRMDRLVHCAELVSKVGDPDYYVAEEQEVDALIARARDTFRRIEENLNRLKKRVANPDAAAFNRHLLQFARDAGFPLVADPDSLRAAPAAVIVYDKPIGPRDPLEDLKDVL